MGSKAFQVVHRPMRPEANGTLFQVDRSNFDWFDKLLHKYSSKSELRKMIKRFPRIGGIQIVDGEEEVALITIIPKSNEGQFVISHFTGANQEADFSLLMIHDKNDLRFFSHSSNVSDNDFRQVSNFVIGVYTFAHLMHIEKNEKHYKIEPIQIFDQDLV